MNKWIRINVTTHALRCIDRIGGFDEFLLFGKPKLLKDSEWAQKTRYTLIKLWEEKNNQKFNRSRLVFQARLQQLENAKNEEYKKWSEKRMESTEEENVDEENEPEETDEYDEEYDNKILQKD